MPDDEKIIEAMARAMSKAELGTESIWDHFLNEARRQLAAHRAMLAAVGLMQRDMVSDWIETTFPADATEAPPTAETSEAISGHKDG